MQYTNWHPLIWTTLFGFHVLAQVPRCAVPCISSAVDKAGCNQADIACQCSSSSQIAGFRALCIIVSCTAPEGLQSAIQGERALCVEFLATKSTITTTTNTPPTTGGPSSTSSNRIASSSTTRSTIISTSSPNSQTPTDSSTSASSSTSSKTSIATLSELLTFSSTSTRQQSATVPSTPSSGLTTGAKAGVGVGAVIGTGIFAVLVWIALMMRKRQKAKTPSQTSLQIQHVIPYPELGPGLPHEMATVERRGELDNSTAGDNQNWDWGQPGGKSNRGDARELQG